MFRSGILLRNGKSFKFGDKFAFKIIGVFQEFS